MEALNEDTFWLDIEPVPQERVRVKISGYGKYRRITPYIPENTRNFQDEVRDMVREYMREHGLSEFGKKKPLHLEAIFYLTRPESAKKRRAPIVRPDLSNYLKSLEDGLQRSVKNDEPALLEEDSAICSIYCEKRYVDEEYPTTGILVTIREWGVDE